MSKSPSPRRTAHAQRLRESGLGESFGFLLSRAGVLTMEVANQALAEFGLSAQEFMVLSYSSVTPPPSQRELAAVLLLDPSRIVGLVDRLEELDLVVRATSQTDRRVKEVGATDAGRDLIARAGAAIERAHAAQTAGIDPDELVAFTNVLGRVALD